MADGIIIIDKPAGWTSMDVCGKLRGILKTKKVGHAGTLDPMATGVLPVFVTPFLPGYHPGRKGGNSHYQRPVPTWTQPHRNRNVYGNLLS